MNQSYIMLYRRCLVQKYLRSVAKNSARSVTIIKQRLNETRHQSFVSNDESKQTNLVRVEQKVPTFLKLSHIADDIGRHFLPKEYPSSVGEGYLGFARGQFFASMFGSAGGVLAMQSLLYAVGLGSGAIPLAATVNWVLRDGLGQLGGVLFSSFAGGRFDADPKRWRMAAAVALEASALVELLTPLAPAYFLFIASVANIGKNISFLAASASRAAIHKSFAISENLADVTAKTGSQTIFSSTLGTGLGIALASLIGNEYSLTVAAFLSLSSCSLLSNFFSIRSVTINTISLRRLECLLAHYLSIDKLLLQQQQQQLMDTAGLMKALQPSTSLYEKQLLSPQEVRAMERLLAVPTYAVLPPLVIGADVSEVIRNTHELEMLLSIFPSKECKYIINVTSRSNSSGSSVGTVSSEVTTHILLREGATLHDVVMGLTVAYMTRVLLLDIKPGEVRSDNRAVLEQAKLLADSEVFPGISLRRSFADKLVLSEQSQWLASSGLLETRFARVSNI